MPMMENFAKIFNNYNYFYNISFSSLYIIKYEFFNVDLKVTLKVYFPYKKV